MNGLLYCGIVGLPSIVCIISDAYKLYASIRSSPVNIFIGVLYPEYVSIFRVGVAFNFARVELSINFQLILLLEIICNYDVIDI